MTFTSVVTGSMAFMAVAFAPEQRAPAVERSPVAIFGHVAAEPGAGLRSAVGLRVSASPADEMDPSRIMTATAASDWSFRMTGAAGSYRFSASADRAPFVNATRVTVDGVEAPSGSDITLASGNHDVVVFVARLEPPAAVDRALPSSALIDKFMHEERFWSQFAIAQALAERRDASVLPQLESWLTHEDRHVRGNAAFLFAALGDPRGFQTIVEILRDRSDRPEGQGIGAAAGDGRYHVEAQIRSDRYYAAHLLGDLRDPRAVPILAPLLKDREVNSIVPWSLGQIGGTTAVGPLLQTLDDDDPSMRVMAIYALETLRAQEALPSLTSLLKDERKATFGAQVTVAEAARAAIASLR